jgi:hypothetical protein
LIPHRAFLDRPGRREAAFWTGAHLREKYIIIESTIALPSVQTSRSFSAAVIVPSPVTLANATP